MGELIQARQRFEKKMVSDIDANLDNATLLTYASHRRQGISPSSLSKHFGEVDQLEVCYQQLLLLNNREQSLMSCYRNQDGQYTIRVNELPNNLVQLEGCRMRKRRDND